MNYKIQHYKGSLDFPCNICNSNSYDNYHFNDMDCLVFVCCKKCLLEVLKDEC